MTNQQQGVIALVKSALTGEKFTLPNDFDFSDTVALAKKHGITTMIYYGALKCGIPNNLPEMQELFLLTCQNVAVSEQQYFDIETIFSNFDKQSIEYMPLKGTLLKKMYPKAEMRIMGDADILIKTEQYDRIKPIMEELGYTEKIESDHELTWFKGKMCIELHKRLIPSYNKDYYAYFGDGWQLAKVKDGTRYSMTDEDNMIYLFTHFAKHYRDAGIGIRHIVDLWVYRKAKPYLDENYIKAELKKLQLFDFYVNIIDTLDVWFGEKTPTDITDFITQIIFNSGVYGEAEKHIVSSALKESKKVGSAENVKKEKFLNTLFLPYKNMCLVYPLLKKIPILLPFYWVYRIVKAILFKQGKIKRISNEISSITNDKMNSYQQSLNFVGLDFNFKE